MQKVQTECVVITDDHWLFAGVAALFSPGVCCRISLKGTDLPPVPVNRAKKPVMIVVDCQLLYQGGGAVFHHVVHLYQRSQVIWLTLKSTGRLFPYGGDRQGMLARAATVTQFRRMLFLTRQWRGEDISPPCHLTQAEQTLLSQLLKGKNIPQLAHTTGKPAKTLYTHQRNILHKTGFHSLCFLLYVYHKNRSVFEPTRPCPENQKWINHY